MSRAGAGLDTGRATELAALRATEQAARGLDGASADLAFLFLSPHHLGAAAEAAAAVRSTLEPRCLLGCVAGGIIGLEHEVESGPAAAVFAASLPGATLVPFALDRTDENGLFEDVPDRESTSFAFLLIDPFTVPGGALVERLNQELPGVPVVGGLATGGGRSGVQALLLDDELREQGAVGALVQGGRIVPVVSQGCTPLGGEVVITDAEENVVLELAGKPALERLRELILALPTDRQVLASRGLLAGLVIDENKPDYGREDFLIRGILAADEDTGALVIGEQVRIGQTLRFHARDAASASADLKSSLDRAIASGPQAAGALLFSCNGRGTGMFGEESHDARAVSSALGSTAVAGFMAGGEIGPVGGRTFLHGFTATMALFLADEPAAGDQEPRWRESRRASDPRTPPATASST